MDPTSDAELVARARTGDVDAFTTLVGRYRLPAVRLAYGIAGNDGEVGTHGRGRLELL